MHGIIIAFVNAAQKHGCAEQGISVLTVSEKKLIKSMDSVWKTFDKDQSGYLDETELREMLVAVVSWMDDDEQSEEVSATEVQAFIRYFDGKKTGHITKEDFLTHIIRASKLTVAERGLLEQGNNAGKDFIGLGQFDHAHEDALNYFHYHYNLHH